MRRDAIFEALEETLELWREMVRSAVNWRIPKTRMHKEIK